MPKQRTTVLTWRVPTEHADAASRDSQAGDTPTTSNVPTSERPDHHDETTPRGVDAHRRRRPRILRMAVRVFTVALVLLPFGGVVAPYVYIYLIAPDPPKPLTFETTNSTPTKSNSTAATDSTTASGVSTPADIASAYKIANPSLPGISIGTKSELESLLTFARPTSPQRSTAAAPTDRIPAR